MCYIYISLALNLGNPTGKLLVYVHPYMSENGRLLNVYEEKLRWEILTQKEGKQLHIN
jgi:hypothetical protein